MWITWWESHAAGCHSDLPIACWLSSEQHVFNSKPTQMQHSDSPGVGNIVHCNKLGVWFRYTRCAGRRWYGSWQNSYHSGSSNAMQTADWEGCFGVAVVNIVGEYPWRVGEYRAERLSWDNQWWTGVVSMPENKYSALWSFQDQEISTSMSSCAYFSPCTNAGCHNTLSGRDIQECHWWNDIWNWVQIGVCSVCRRCVPPHEHLYTSGDKPEYRQNICLVSFDTITSRAKPSSNSKYLYRLWSFGSLD